MSILRAAVQAGGADYMQWRGLVSALIKEVVRNPQASAQGRKRERKPRLVPWIMRAGMLAIGAAVANLSVLLPSLFLFSLVTLTAAGVLLFVFLLQEFQAVAVSPKDYEVLGHRPVGARTYLLVRLTVVMAHEGLIAALIVSPSAVVCGFRFGWLPATGLLAATLLMVLTIVLGVIAMYSTLIDKVGAGRLKSVLGYVQLPLAAMYMIPLIFKDRLAGMLQAVEANGPESWMLALPTAWYAGFASLFGGSPTAAEWLTAATAVTCCAAMGWLLRDRLSLASAEKLGAQPQTHPGGRQERRSTGPGLARFGRLRVAATLIRGQFRHDVQFRTSAFALLPLFVVYLFLALRASGTVDPFVPGARVFSLFGIHFALLAAPVMYLELLYASENYLAGWILFASPVDRARLAAEARYCIVLFFFLPFVAVAGICLAWLFGNAWHASAHTFLLAGLGLLSMQISQYVAPRLPFARPRKLRRGGLMLAQMMGVGLVAGLLGPYVVFAYSRPAWTAGTFAAVVLGAAVMERLLPARLQRRLRWPETES